MALEKKGSETLSGVANGSLATKQFHFVKIDGLVGDTCRIAACGAGEKVTGVLQDKPVAGQAGEVWTNGISKVFAGDAVNVGQEVQSDANGRAIPLAAGKAAGIACAAADEDGDLISVLLL